MKCYGLWVACFVILAMLFFITPVAKAASIQCDKVYADCLQQQCASTQDGFGVPETNCVQGCRDQQTECEYPDYPESLLNTDNIKEPTRQEENKTPMQRLENIGGKSGFADSGVPTDTAGEVLPAYLGAITRGAMVLLGVIFFALMVYGGFLWLYAGGNDEQVTKAKSIIIRALIGFLIVIFAGGITQFILYYAGR